MKWQNTGLTKSPMMSLIITGYSENVQLYFRIQYIHMLQVTRLSVKNIKNKRMQKEEAVLYVVNWEPFQIQYVYYGIKKMSDTF